MVGVARRVLRQEASTFLAQAKEFLETAKGCLEDNRNNAAAFNAIQAMINANDALTIHFLEERGR